MDNPKVTSEQASKKPSKIPYIIMAVAILAIVYFFVGGKGGSVTGGTIVDTSEEIKISLDGITKKATFYEYDGIKYFAIKSGDSVKTAFDACDVCYNSRKGYRQQGEDMICNNCGNHYPISGLGTKNLRGGGCWPGYLPSKASGDYLVIKKSDLEKNRFMFG